MSEQPSSTASQPSTESAGDMLRTAREQKGLSIEQAAAHLNLRPSLVTDLESEHYEQLRISTYRRGYLRAYARLLEIDPEKVLKAHDDRHGKVDEPIKVSTPIKPIKRPSRLGKVVFWIITIIIILLIIGLTTQWWKSRSGNDFSQQGDATSAQQMPGQANADNTAATNSQPSSTDTTGDNQSSSSSAAASGTSNTASSGNTQNGTGNNTSSNLSNGSDNTSNDLQKPVGNGVDGANLTTSEAASLSQQDQSAANANANNSGTSSSSATAASGAPTNAAPNSITLQFNQQSWTRITDASGHTVLSGLQQAGSQQTVSGTPPFRLTVGNASGVSINYQGQPVNLAAKTARSNVARFTLGN